MDIISILHYAIKHNSSDVHLSSGEKPLIRIDGNLEHIPNTDNLSEAIILDMLQKVLPEEKVKECRENKEVDLAINVENLSRFRVNVFHQLRGISVALRVIPHHIPTIAELGLPSIFHQLCNQPNGLILITGPTGCGKTTTLAAMIDYLNQTKEGHILTIEDPIEYVHDSNKALIQQREVGNHTDSFKNALRSVLREDPNYILVGEMRDLETIRLALTAAETGHLVFATLHTNSAAESVNRIIDVFPAGEKEMIRSMLASSLQAVISQILVRKIGGGRIVAQEVMICNTAIRNMIREDKVHQIYSVIQTGIATGMKTLEQSLQALIENGIIDAERYGRGRIGK